MKMKQDHYETLKTSFEKFSHVIKPHRATITQQNKAKDIEKRLRWDMLYTTTQSKWVCDELYPYLNDDHIDTALRNIMKDIGE